MSYYEPQAWQAPVRQTSWEQPPPPSRSGASSTSQRDDGAAFGSQFEEVDRAIDNLVKSGKFFPPGSRRDSIPMMMAGGRHYPDHDPRMHSGMSPRHSLSEFDPSRSHSASNLQNFYASQRYQSRPSEAEQMMQAKRRMAAQRERELRNYHQEQQYNRSLLAEMSSNKSDRSMSPSTMSEEGRRELIARQHRALYGNEAPGFNSQSGFSDDGSTPRESGSTVPTTSAGGARGNSPRGMDPFGMGQATAQNAAAEKNSQNSSATPQESGRPESSASPASGTTSAAFGNFDGTAQQSSNTSTSPAGGESPSRQVTKSTTAPIGSGMGPIGSRPAPQQAPNPALNKRSTTPLPSPLSYGFGSSDQVNNNERSGSANSNSNAQKDSNSNPGIATWGTGSGVWGSNKMGATSVWG